jgi:ribosomal protein S24E
VQVPSTLYVHVYESPIQAKKLERAEILLNVIDSLNANSEISKGRGLLVMI